MLNQKNNVSTIGKFVFGHVKLFRFKNSILSGVEKSE